MGCCGNSTGQAASQAAQTGPRSGTILSRRSHKYVDLHQALVERAPNGGWVFSTSVNGIPLKIQGASAVDVMVKTRQYFFTNGLPFDEPKFWLQANIQWLHDTHEKYHLVGLGDLLATASEAAPQEPVPAPDDRSPAHPPARWGPIAWRFLGLVLAKTSYDPAEFIGVMRLVTDMLNPDTNPRLGCSECHIKAAGMLNELIHHPPADLAAARIWLVRKHNIVNARLGKPELGMSDAAEANFWN